MLGTKMVTNPYKLQRIVMCMCEGMSKLMNSKEMSVPSSDIMQVPSTSVRTRASQRSTEREKQAGDRSPTSVQAEFSEDAESLRDTRQDSSDSDYKVSSTDKSDSEDEDWEAQSTKASKKKVSRTSRTRSKSDGKTRSPAKRRGRKPVDRFCTICQKEFITIERHMLIHNSTRSFKCDECGKAFFEMRVLQKHKATHENKFKCNVCGEQFSKVRQARRHARIHVAEKPYVCEVCKRPFRARRELRKHMLVHSNVRQYMCHICGHSSRLLSQFKAHQRSHTGEKPYVCEICGKAFRYSSGLRVHSFSHTTGKPYRCLICNESFAHNYLLKRHRLSHDEMESAPCETQELSTITIELPDSNTLSEQSGTPLQLRLVEFLPKTNMQHHSSEYSSEISIPSLNQTLQLEHPAPSQLLEQTPQDPNTSTQTSDSPPQIQPSKESEDFTTCQSNALPQLQSQNPATSQQLLNEQIMQAGDASLIHTFLGPEMLKENLMYGPGSRRRTVEDCLVVPLSKESIKGQHSDSKTSVGMS
ncbi:uncharacterized protein [Diadema antillarum]|uniref:uncharacterized protein n=1 Tax=Diadema antillarum TaxID=105358 RepID=UPI003A83D86E